VTALRYETWFITFAKSDDRRRSWVRVECPSKDEVRAFAAQRYGVGVDELIPDVCFNPDLYPDGELNAYRLPFRLEAVT
jgi:hypothetical protein